MNKSNHRYETLDPISKIHANLKEMRVEVGQYLKKHSIDKVPPILKPKHSVLVDAFSDIGSVPQSLKPQKMTKELSSQKLGHILEGDRFKPLRQCDIDRKETNKIVRQKRLLSTKNQANSGLYADTSYLLPNICNVKLEFDDQNISNQSLAKSQLEEKRLNLILQKSYQAQSPQTKRYHSIDLNQSALFENAIKSTINSTLKGSTGWALMERSKKTPKHFRNLSYSTKGQPDPFLQTLNQRVKLKDVKHEHEQKQIPQSQHHLKYLQPLKDISSQEHKQEFNQILRNYKQFDEQVQNIERRKVYSKIGNELSKKSQPRFPYLRKVEPKRHIAYFQKKHVEKLAIVKIQNMLDPLEPWQDQEEQKEKPLFIFQSSIF